MVHAGTLAYRICKSNWENIVPPDKLSRDLIHLRCFQLASATAMTAEPWVSVEQVTPRLGVAKDAVYHWRERQGLPPHRIGRLSKFKLSEGDEWARAGGADEGKDQRSGGVA